MQNPEAELPYRPTYAAAFRCIGSECEDHCCGDWDIPLDKATHAKYKQFPPERLGAVVSNFVFVNEIGAPDGLFAHIHRAPSGLCPFFGADRLCGIQKEYGAQLLSATCSVFPRSLSQVEGRMEGSLSLSCPEAARNVLLDPDFMWTQGDLLSGAFRTDNVYHLRPSTSGADRKPYRYFLAIRTLLIATVRDRSRPLWQRLILIGFLCMRIEHAAATGGDDAVGAFLDEFPGILNTPQMQADLENLPSDPRLRLEIVMALTDERVRDNTGGLRFRDTFWTFIEGIGSAEASPPGDDANRFLEAEQKYCGPFIEKYPFILENYLLNYMFQNLFPFGPEGSTQSAPQSLFEEYILMATQFAWIETLLIGISAYHREDFAEQHVIVAVQSFTRAVEHFPFMRRWINEYMSGRRLAGLAGMAIMLRC
jgi:lysine-N-methylase